MSSRYSLSGEWQRARNVTTTRITAYGIAYDLDLFSNFTFFLKDSVRGDHRVTPLADSDIEYYFASRLPGEPLSGVDDRHIHPTLPRTVRLNLSIEF